MLDLKSNSEGFLLPRMTRVQWELIGGYYWSSSQGSITDGWSQGIDSGGSEMYNFGRSDGFPLRCLRD